MKERYSEMPELRNANVSEAGPAPTSAVDLMAQLERRIVDGVLPPGARLAPVRAAAGELGLAPNTVAAAYRQLQDRGYVFSDGRRGTFVSQRQDAARPADQAIQDGLVDLASGNPDRSLLPDLRPALSAISTEQVLNGQRAIDLRLAAYLADDLEPDLGPLVAEGIEAERNLAVVGGALDGIERTLAAYLRPGDRVAVEDPAYTSIIDLVAAMNLRAVSMSVDSYGVEPDQLAQALSGGPAAVIHHPSSSEPDRGRPGPGQGRRAFGNPGRQPRCVGHRGRPCRCHRRPALSPDDSSDRTAVGGDPVGGEIFGAGPASGGTGRRPDHRGPAWRAARCSAPDGCHICSNRRWRNCSVHHRSARRWPPPPMCMAADGSCSSIGCPRPVSVPLVGLV